MIIVLLLSLFLGFSNSFCMEATSLFFIDSFLKETPSPLIKTMPCNCDHCDEKINVNPTDILEHLYLKHMPHQYRLSKQTVYNNATQTARGYRITCPKKGCSCDLEACDLDQLCYKYMKHIYTTQRHNNPVRLKVANLSRNCNSIQEIMARLAIKK